MRWAVAVLALVSSVGCRSADLRGPGPAYPPAVGLPSNRETALPPPANQPTNYGYGAAYDPHGTGSRGQTATPLETGAIPYWWWAPPPWPPIGVPPPPVVDDRGPVERRP